MAEGSTPGTVRPAAGAPRRAYWRAQGLVEEERAAFEAARAAGDADAERDAYYRLAAFHGRTIRILRSAVAEGREPLAQVAMGNLAELHRAMARMHREAAHDVPVALVLDREGRDEVARDLVVRALAESAEPLTLDELAARVDALDVMAEAPGTVRRHLRALVASGHAEERGGRPARYRRGARDYAETDRDGLGLRALVGAEAHAALAAAGFDGLSDLAGRREAFARALRDATGLGATSAALLADLAATLLADEEGTGGPWPHADLLGSSIPRPYQREAHAVFRGFGYRGQLVEAPTGSGKTMVGMLCIQDWLRGLHPGQSILVLVPTSNYLQQWTGELCTNPIGLRLSPESVFAGTPGQLARFQQASGSHPAVLVMTYTALAQAGSGVGKGGFDADSIEMFLQGARVRHVILDEVHKVAESLRSVSADVVRLLRDWLEDGSLHGLIGFTGTAEAYRRRFERLRLELVYGIPIEELIAAGFVAPFAELGAPFAYSERERRVRARLDRYKAGLRDYLALLDGAALRARFAAIPLEARAAIGHDLLGMYAGRRDGLEETRARLRGWETGGDLALTEVKLLSILQIAEDADDRALVRAMGADEAAFDALRDELDALRADLASDIHLEATAVRLGAPGFGARLDAAALRAAWEAAPNQAARRAAVAEGLSGTIAGLYEDLSGWYQRVGEGRVAAVKAIIDAEAARRSLGGIIVFDRARRLDARSGPARPGYGGVAGLFAELLGDPRFTPYAVLSSEQYLPFDEEDPLPPRVADYIVRELLQGEVADAMHDLVFQGLDLPAEAAEDLRALWEAAIERYASGLRDVHAPRLGELRRKVLRPLRRRLRAWDLGPAGERALARMDLRNVHFADLAGRFFDYAILARHFREARVAELEQVSGTRRRYFVIPMSDGRRKLLMYDLTSRIVDAPSLPIDLVIVSGWARTGWNVIEPNLLIDATATRDVTAWQQLRGRAIRARRSWTNDAYRLLTRLVGGQIHGAQHAAESAARAQALAASVHEAQPTGGPLDADLRALLDEVASPAQRARVDRQGLAALPDEERLALAVALMRRFNKVTHIYELVKAYGSTSQVTLDRASGRWRRRDVVAAKHAHEIAVNPLDGRASSGVEHAPLIYAEDPRQDLPSALRRHLAELLTGRDERIVAGWLRHGLEDAAQPLGGGGGRIG